MSSTLPPGTSINRWVIAIAAFCLQLALGAVYAWSVFLKPVISKYHVTPPQATLTFSITLLALGITAGFGGSLNSRFGPRAIAIAGGILYGLGTVLAGLAAPNIYVLYLTYGIIGGIGLGLGYIVPIAMLIKWFPDRRGFITGLAVAGFGAGAALTGPLAANFLLPTFKLNMTFIILGIVYFIIVIIAALFFRTAPDGYAPVGWTPSSTQTSTSVARSYTLAEALRSPRWYLLWFILALNVTAGAALISVASPLAQEFTGVSVGVASTLVITISIFNGAGRLFWGWLSDATGRPYTFLIIFIVQIFAFLATPFIGSIALLFIPASIIGLCYGGGFGTMPAFAADFFGPKNAGTIYGAMLTAWSAGGIVGPLLIASLDHKTALYILAALMLVSCVLPLVAQRLTKQAKVATEVAAGAGE